MADRSEFDGFVAARSPQLLRTAYLLTREWALAGDLLQTALATSWFAWGRLDADPEPYVRKVLVNTCAARRRPTSFRSGPVPTRCTPSASGMPCGGAGPAAAAAARRAWFADGPGWTFDLQHDAAR